MRAPPLPTGFTELVSPEAEPQAAARRPARRPRTAKSPPLPNGFTEHVNAANDQGSAPSQPLSATGQAHDGDTFNLADGRRARLYGVDAFEAGQMGRDAAGAPVPLGDNAREAFLPYLPGSTAKPTGGNTYGRPVATLTNAQGDAGQGMVSSGNALPRPEYLRADPARLADYVAAQRGAIADERGAYSGTYQDPTDYRRQGDAAAWRGKLPMNEQQAAEYAALVRNPATTAAELEAWARAQGGGLTNAENILSFYRRNPNAKDPGYFQQLDVQDAPVMPAGQNIVTRHLGALNEGIADTLGAPVDIVNAGLGALGLPMSDRPFLGSDSIREGMHWLGMGQTDQTYAPRSDLERYSQSFSRGIGQAVVPAGALPAAGGRAALSVVPRVAAPSAGRLAVRDMLAEAARRPGVVVAGELGAGAGSGIGAQVADDYAPGNPWASMAAQFLGGVAGGLGAGVPTARFGNREGLPLPGRTPPTGSQGPDFAYIDEDGALTFNVSDEAGPQPRPLPASAGAAVPDAPPAAAQRQPIDPASFNQADNAELLDRVRRTLMEQSEPEWASAVRSGQANDRPDLLGAYDELSGAVAELQRRGVNPDMIERDIAATLRGRGWTHDQIADVMPDRFANMRALPRTTDHLDLPAAAPGARIAGDGLGLRDGPSSIDTRQPVREAPPPRDIADVQGDIDAWAQGQGIGDEGVMLHGSPNGTIDSFDPYGRSGYGLFGTGTYLTDSPSVAASYSKKGAGRLSDPDRSIYAVEQTVRNPIDMDAAAEPERWAELAEMHGFDVPPGTTNEQAFRALETAIAENDPALPQWEGAEMVSDAIRSMGYDGITHIGGGRVSNGPRHRVVIALDPEQTAIRGRLSVSDLLNPPGPRAADWIDVDDVDMPAQRLPAGRSANMDAEGLDDLSISAPVRDVDRADVRKVPPPPADFNELIGGPSLGRAGRMDERPSPEQLAEMARRVDPGDVTPLPANAVESMEEAQAIGAGMRPPVRGGDERAALETRRFPSTRDPSRTLPRKGPLDLVSWLRVHGGLRPQGGELAHYGIDNAPRALDFAQAENRLGKLVDPENGLSYDEAALRAWEAGYFPDHAERPTVSEFLDALQATHSGRNRSFRSGDLGEVDAFEAARRQRFAVEQAAQEGWPLVDDLGQPITQADLDANAPPATAYEDLPQIGGRVGNIDISKLETRQDIRRLLQTTDNRAGGFDAARRGRISQAETEALASELGMTANTLLQRRQGQALNAEEALAARQLLAKSSDELIRLAGKVEGGSDADLAEFRRAWLRHAAIQEQVTGATAEAGRALAQFKMAARGNAVKGRVHAAMIEGSGGADRLKEAAEMILDLQARGVPPGQVNKAAVDALKPKWSDKLVELWYNSILSGPQTHAVNILSNATTAALQIPEMALASAIGGARRAMNLGSADRVVAREIGARAYGLLTGAREGLRAFARTIKTGEVPDFVTKVEARTQRAISGKKGEVIRFPTRALAAEDELSKAIARNMEIRGLAARKASFEGLTGEAYKARVAELIANPDEKMTQMALDYARYLTFQRPLGPAGQSVSRFTQNMPVTKLFLPFIRTPANIFKHVLERSPAAPLLKEWRADWKAGGAQRDLAISRTVLGTGLGMIATELARQGLITGSGPMDQGAENFMRADGWQPYSVKIGDRYYSYQRLDPLASTLGVAADLATKGQAMTEQQSEEAVTLLVASIMKNLSDKTWLSGMSDLVEALEDPERNAKRVVGRLAGSLAVPAIVGQSTRVVDPTLRQTRDPLDFVKARIPGVSDDLPAKRDVWGREIVRDGGVGPDIVSPIWTQSARNDPLNAEMLAAGVRIGPVPRQVGGRELTRAEHDQYAALSGSIMEGNMRALIESPAWKVATIEEKQDMADDVKKRARKEARDALFGGYRKASAKPPGLEMPDDVADRIFTGPQAPPPPEGFTVPVSPRQ